MIRDFNFVQSYEAYSIDLNPGMFKFEAWGAAGGGGDKAGKGGYSSGVLTLRKKLNFSYMLVEKERMEGQFTKT